MVLANLLQGSSIKRLHSQWTPDSFVRSFVFLFLWIGPKAAYAQYATVTGNVSGELTHNVDARIIVIKPYDDKTKTSAPAENVTLSIQPNGDFKIEHVKPGEYCLIFCHRKVLNDTVVCDGDPSYRPYVIPKVKLEAGKLKSMGSVLLQETFEHRARPSEQECPDPQNCRVSLRHRITGCEIRIIPDKEGVFAFPFVEGYSNGSDSNEQHEYYRHIAPFKDHPERTDLSKPVFIPKQAPTEKISAGSQETRESQQ